MIYLFCLLLFASEDHETIRLRQNDLAPSGPLEACPVTPAELSRFASGEGGFLDTLPIYLTASACTSQSLHLGSLALPDVKFQTRGPYAFLKSSAQSLQQSRFELSSTVEARLLKRLPAAFRESPLSNSDFNVVGQLSIISPRLGRKALGNLIRTTLLSEEESPALAEKLLRYGAGLDLISLEVAEQAKEISENAEAQSLGKLLANLSLAASIESELAPVFNRSAFSTNEGTLRAFPIYTASDRTKIAGALFAGLDGSLAKNGLEPGVLSLGEALERVIGRVKLETDKLKLAMKILSQSETQNALSKAAAASMDLKILTWKGVDRDHLISAATHYEGVTLKLEQIYLTRLTEAYQNAELGKVAQYNQAKREELSPLADSILGLPPEWVHPHFVHQAVAFGMVVDSQIEGSVPRIALYRLRDDPEVDKSSDSILSHVTRQFDDEIALQLTLIPALSGWIERQVTQ